MKPVASSSTALQTGLGWYLDRIKSTPLLTAEQERQLARRVREHSDPIAREQMIAANLRLVVKIAKEYTNPGMTLGDLVAEGNLGLMRAVEEFNPDAGVRFSTYAAWWVKQAIKRAMINAGQPVHIPAYLAKLIAKWRRAAGQLEAQLGRPPTVEEMAKRLRISRKKAQIVQRGLQAVNAPTQVDSEETSAISEIVPDGKGRLPEQALLDASNSPIVRSLLRQLEPRQRRILELRFGLDGYQGPPRTFKEIGRMVGLTRERVRQLGKQALAELKAQAERVA
jgi:RNA polymerase primary sigma factor